MKSFRYKTIAQFLSALLLVVAQCQLLVHQTDIEAHSDQSSCEYCIHFSHLGSGTVGEVSSVSQFPHLALDLPSLYIPAVIYTTYALPPTRAPPASSLS